MSEPVKHADHELLAEIERQWPRISTRTAARVTRIILWNRRLQAANTVLCAAVVLLSLQAAWSQVLLLRLQTAAAAAVELVHLNSM